MPDLIEDGKLNVRSPYDDHFIREYPLHSEKDVENALSKAHELASSRAKRIPKNERVEILEKCIRIMEERKEEFATQAAEEGGKPLIDSRVEVVRGIQGVRVAINEMSTMHGEEIPMGWTTSSSQRLAMTIREPIGPVVAISAFNHPFNLIVHQVVPAVATGCPVIVKPAPTTPISCFNVVETLYEAGLPKEWCQVLITDNAAAEKLVTDSRVGFFTFIGSAKVGWYLRSKLAPGTRCALEHGGAAPVIFENDANLDDALPLLAKGGFYHAGQVCVSVQRVFAHKSVAKNVADGLAQMAEKMNVGDPVEEKTEVGPLILPREVTRVDEWVNEARSAGGKVVCGGKKLSNSLYSPTVVMNPSDEVKLSREEIFGPVVAVYEYGDNQEAVKRANQLPFSFQASVFTQNLDSAFGLAQDLDAAAVMINDHSAFRVDWMPFAGRKSSGLGVGGIPYTMKDMTEEKMLVFRSKSL